MKQFIYPFFRDYYFCLPLPPRVVAQEIGDYSQLNDEDYSKIDLPSPVRSIRKCQKQSYL